MYSWSSIQCLKRIVLNGRMKRAVKLKNNYSMIKCSKIYEYSIKEANKDYIKAS